MYPACIPHVSNVQDVSDVYPKMYLGLVWDTCKNTQGIQDTFKIHQDTYLGIHVSFRIHAGYITIHVQDTYPDNNPPQTLKNSITNPPPNP
jgi:hypothetical protein